MTYSEEVASFVCGLDFDAIPKSTIARAKQLMLDTIGVGLSGTRHPNFKAALAGVASIPGSRGDLPILQSDICLSAPYAALVNGVACHVLDFDDTHTASIVHGSAILTPLVLAIGEELSASGTDVLAAFIAGWEVAARVGIASGNSFHSRGFHATAVAGVFGATAATGRLLGLSAEQMTHAFGLCGSQASGINEFLTNNSSSKGYHVGWAAQNGITLAYIARAGATGPTTVFEGDRGVFATHGLHDSCVPSETAADLGSRWEIERVSIKPYPCCHFAHGAIDCAMDLRDDGIDIEEITGVHAVVDEVAAGFICDPISKKYEPSNAYGAKFSLPFLVACGMIDGAVDQSSFTDRSIRRSDLLSLARKVTSEHAQKGTTGFPTYFPGHLAITLSTGETVEKRVHINRGNPDAPLSDEEVTFKFKRNTADVISAEVADHIAEKVGALEMASQVSPITKLLAKS